MDGGRGRTGRSLLAPESGKRRDRSHPPSPSTAIAVVHNLAVIILAASPRRTGGAKSQDVAKHCRGMRPSSARGEEEH